MIRPVWSTKGSFEAVTVDDSNSTVYVHIPLQGASRQLCKGGYTDAARAAERLARKLEATQTQDEYIAVAEAWYRKP